MLPLKEFVQNRYNKSIAECNEELYLALLNYSSSQSTLVRKKVTISASS